MFNRAQPNEHQTMQFLLVLLSMVKLMLILLSLRSFERIPSIHAAPLVPRNRFTAPESRDIRSNSLMQCERHYDAVCPVRREAYYFKMSWGDMALEATGTSANCHHAAMPIIITVLCYTAYQLMAAYFYYIGAVAINRYRRHAIIDTTPLPARIQQTKTKC